jgi:hypothetical protein
MKWRKLLTAGAVAGMLAISGCSSNVPENNLGNRNGIRVTESAHRNYAKPRTKAWRNKGVNWSRSNMNRSRNITRSRDSRAVPGTVNNTLNRRARSSFDSRAYNRSASAPIYRARRAENASRLNQSTVRRPSTVIGGRTVTPKKTYKHKVTPRRTYQKPAINKTAPKVSGLMKNDYSLRFKNYDFALARNNPRYARIRQRMNQPRILHKNKYGASSNAYRNIKPVALVEIDDAVQVMSNQSQSIKGMEPSVNVKVSDLDGVINSLSRMRGVNQIKPAVSKARQPIRISYKQKNRTRDMRKIRARALGISKPVATIYFSGGHVVKVDPGTNAVTSSTLNRPRRMTRSTMSGRMPARNYNSPASRSYVPSNNSTMMNRSPIIGNGTGTYNPMPARRIMRTAGMYK